MPETLSMEPGQISAPAECLRGGRPAGQPKQPVARTRHRLAQGQATALTLLLVGLTLWLYWPVLVPMARQWYVDPNYSHGMLIPLLTAYFVWERRDRLSGLAPRPSWAGLGLLLTGFFILMVGQVGAELFLQRISLLVVSAGLFWFVVGRRAFRVLVFPIAFLVFMIPLPAIVLNAVAFPLQLFAAQAATMCLVALDVPVLREGNVISLASTTLEVAEACSGIRSLMSLLALGTVYAYFTEQVMWKRWVIVVAAIPVAIAANAFRVAGTGVLAHYFGEEAAQGFYHDFSGWLVFVVAFLLLLGIGSLLKRPWTQRRALEKGQTQHHPGRAVRGALP
jgi:exosortase